MCLTSFVVINSMGNIFAAVQEYDARANDGNPIAHDISDASVVSPSLAFACWGFADAQIQVFCYWLMGGLYKSGRDHSRGVGFYKLVQSLGSKFQSLLLSMNPFYFVRRSSGIVPFLYSLFSLDWVLPHPNLEVK